MNRSSAEVEAEVEASRNELDRNVEALKQKMTPGQLFDEAARAMGGTGQQVASKFAEQAKANPMPLAVMGLGLAWLMMSNNRQGSQTSGYVSAEPRSFASGSYGGPSGGVTEGLKDKAHAVGDKAHELMSGVQDKIAGAKSSLADTGRSAGQSLGGVRDKATDLGRHAQQTFLDTLQSEPLLLAGIGLVVGAAIGASLPHTAAEDRYLGETRDKLLEKGKDLAQTGMEKASSAAQATYSAVKSELQNGDGEREPADRLGDAARSGVQAAQEQLQGGGAPH